MYKRQAEYSFPEKYEKTSDSGKVKFNCELEVPENIKGQAISTVDVKLSLIHILDITPDQENADIFKLIVSI